MEKKVCRKCKLKLEPFLILVNSPKQQMHPRSSFENKFFEEDYQKTLKKIILFFPKPSPFYGQDYEKQRGPGTSYQDFLG